MGEVLALSAWLGLEALQGGPSIAGRVLDAQTGDPVGGADLGDVRLNRESAALAERVEVRGAQTRDAGPARTLTKADLETLSMVIVDDPLRSVHALPGVAANNDLKAEFSLRGA